MAVVDTVFLFKCLVTLLGDLFSIIMLGFVYTVRQSSINRPLSRGYLGRVLLTVAVVDRWPL